MQLSITNTLLKQTVDSQLLLQISSITTSYFTFFVIHGMLVLKFENSTLVKWLTPGILFDVRALLCLVWHPKWTLMALSGENSGKPSLALATAAVDEGIQYFYGQLCNFCNSKLMKCSETKLV